MAVDCTAVNRSQEQCIEHVISDLPRFLERMAAAGSERGPIGGGREFSGVPLCVTEKPVSDPGSPYISAQKAPGRHVVIISIIITAQIQAIRTGYIEQHLLYCSPVFLLLVHPHQSIKWMQYQGQVVTDQQKHWDQVSAPCVRLLFLLRPKPVRLMWMLSVGWCWQSAGEAGPSTQDAFSVDTGMGFLSAPVAASADQVYDFVKVRSNLT